MILTEYENPWNHNGQSVLEPPEGFYGFVYEITNKISGRKYIGKKFFWSRVSKPPLKGKTRRRRSIKESDWKTYYGSNKELQEDVKEHGVSNFDRTILHLCASKGECTYYECKYQFQNLVLEDSSYYNEWIICKVHSKHIGKTT
jgi:hypothetical protein